MPIVNRVAYDEQWTHRYYPCYFVSKVAMNFNNTILSSTFRNADGFCHVLVIVECSVL